MKGPINTLNIKLTLEDFNTTEGPTQGDYTLLILFSLFVQRQTPWCYIGGKEIHICSKKEDTKCIERKHM